MRSEHIVGTRDEIARNNVPAKGSRLTRGDLEETNRVRAETELSA